MTSLSVFTGATSVVDFPVLGTSTTVPDWVSKRGGDVRAHDLREGRNVYGPGHHFAVEQDIRITNGILRADVGPRNVLPYLTISVYKGGAWRAMGHLYVSEANTLAGARLVTVTPDRAALVLSVRNEGHVTVRLHRGERMLRITHGSTRAPAVSVGRLVQWRSAVDIPPGAGQGWGDANWGDGNWGGTWVATGIVAGSPITNGLMYESTADDGATRFTDANGLTRGLASLRSGAVKPPGRGLAMTKTAVSVHYGAFVATSAAGDDLADHHRQLAAASEQESRIR